MHPPSILSLALVALIFSAISIPIHSAFAEASETAPLRQWEATNGKTLSARILAIREGKIVLQKEDGTELIVAPDYLTAVDREYANVWHSEQSAAAESAVKQLPETFRTKEHLMLHLEMEPELAMEIETAMLEGGIAAAKAAHHLAEGLDDGTVEEISRFDFKTKPGAKDELGDKVWGNQKHLPDTRRLKSQLHEIVDAPEIWGYDYQWLDPADRKDVENKNVKTLLNVMPGHLILGDHLIIEGRSNLLLLRAPEGSLASPSKEPETDPPLWLRIQLLKAPSKKIAQELSESELDPQQMREELDGLKLIHHFGKRIELDNLLSSRRQIFPDGNDLPCTGTWFSVRLTLAGDGNENHHTIELALSHASDIGGNADEPLKVDLTTNLAIGVPQVVCCEQSSLLLVIESLEDRS